MNRDMIITDLTSMKEILEMAVRRAEGCHNFYKEASERSLIKKTKEMLYQIAMNELQHQQLLQSELEELMLQMDIDEAITGESY